MPNTYTQVHIHFVFAVKNRRALLDPSWRGELFKYMTGILQRNGHKVLALNGIEDHVHILIGLGTEHGLARIMQVVKGDSSEWINKRGFCKERFEWQGGYGAFAVQKTILMTVIRYIRNQEEHHRKESFKNEYLKILKEEEIDFDEKYLFKDPE